MVELVDISKASLVASGDYLDQILTYLELLTTFGLGMETITTPWLIAIPTTGTKKPPEFCKHKTSGTVSGGLSPYLAKLELPTYRVARGRLQMISSSPIPVFFSTILVLASHTMIREVNLTLPSYHLHGVFNTMNYDLYSVALFKLPAHAQPSGIESGISASVKASYCLTTCSIG